MLGFSFPSADASAVMSLEGQTFRQLQLAGLSAGQASLLIASAPGGWLLQVRDTAQQRRHTMLHCIAFPNTATLLTRTTQQPFYSTALHCAVVAANRDSCLPCR
jgi:hypothetical protein